MNRLFASLRLLRRLLTLVILVGLGNAQSAMIGQDFGVAWTGRGGIEGESWKTLVQEVATDSGDRRVIPLGKWSKQSLEEAQAQGLQVVVRFAKVNGKHLKAESQAFGKQKGFFGPVEGAHHRLKFVPAEAEVTIELLEIGGQKLAEFTRTERTRMPRQLQFDDNEYKRVIKSDVAEELRKTAKSGLRDAINRADSLWLWNHKEELRRTFSNADRSERLAFWRRFESMMPISMGGRLFPRWTMLQLLRMDVELLQKVRAPVQREPGRLMPCAWCATSCKDADCDVAQHMALVGKIATTANRNYKLNGSAPKEMQGGQKNRAYGEELLRFLEALTAEDEDGWTRCMTGAKDNSGRSQSVPGDPKFLVIGGADAYMALRDLDPDLHSAAKSITYFAPDGHHHRKVWKLPAKGGLIALVDRRGEHKYSKHKAKVLSRGELDAAKYTEALMEIILDRLRSK